MKRIEQRLEATVGLDPAGLGSTLARAVRGRMKSLGLANLDAYVELLARSPAEWAGLIESVVVTETWFFRDEEPFAAVVRLVRDQWLAADPTRTIRLLSLPCASGEEPYSLAMALLDAGVSRKRFQIDAADISARALARARLGVYGRNSFRASDLGFRARHFQATREGFVLEPAVRSAVHFHQVNLLAPELELGQAAYDVIFCRNLLIYLEPARQREALGRLKWLLAPEGVLFLGAAEQTLALADGFVSANLPQAFACRKAGAGAGSPKSVARRGARSLPSLPPRAVPVEPRGWNPGMKPALPVGEPAPARADLGQAQQLAKAGSLAEAKAICEAHLRQAGPSAPAYYLLGLVHEAAGDPHATDFYRKALYLEPEHYESLLQLALHAEKNGDALSARTLKRRAARVARVIEDRSGGDLSPPG